jgi:single stranded DNA-binding protein
MAGETVITVVGNITDDPELRFTPSGAAVANFTVAVNRRFKNGDRWEDKLDGFFRCNVWADMAENVAESLTKGTRIVVTGRLQQRAGRQRSEQRHRCEHAAALLRNEHRVEGAEARAAVLLVDQQPRPAGFDRGRPKVRRRAAFERLARSLDGLDPR